MIADTIIPHGGGGGINDPFWIDFFILWLSSPNKLIVILLDCYIISSIIIRERILTVYHLYIYNCLVYQIIFTQC